MTWSLYKSKSSLCYSLLHTKLVVTVELYTLPRVTFPSVCASHFLFKPITNISCGGKVPGQTEGAARECGR